MKTNYEQLRTRINELLPDRVKLEEGCEIKIWWMDAPQDRPNDPDETTFFTERTMRDNGGVDGKYSQIIEDNVTGTVEILGKPLTIEDVLRALNKTKNWNTFNLSLNARKDVDTAEFWNSNNFQEKSFDTIKVDLTKSLSAPENEEACEAVLELLK